MSMSEEEIETKEKVRYHNELNGFINQEKTKIMTSLPFMKRDNMRMVKRMNHESDGGSVWIARSIMTLRVACDD